MIVGAHIIIFSTDAGADRAFLRDICRFPDVDAGDGWLIFELPPAEVAVHPSGENGVHELYLLCDDISGFIDEMRSHNIVCDPILDQSYGLVTHLVLPGGGKLGVYQPRHERPGAIERDGLT